MSVCRSIYRFDSANSSDICMGRRGGMSSTYSRLSIANSNFKQFFPFSEAGFFNFPSNSKIFFLYSRIVFLFLSYEKKEKRMMMIIIKKEGGRKNGSSSHFCCNLKPWNNEAKNLKGYTQQGIPLYGRIFEMERNRLKWQL